MQWLWVAVPIGVVFAAASRYDRRVRRRGGTPRDGAAMTRDLRQSRRDGKALHQVPSAGDAPWTDANRRKRGGRAG